MPSYSDHFVADEIFPADVAIVFGMTAWQRPCARAIELYRAGMAKTLLFTGGFNSKMQAVEAIVMARGARSQGVPDAAIIVEPEATNTTANVENALACLEQSLGLGNVNSVLLVAIHFHMRRVKAIVEATFPGHIRIGTASYPSVHYTAADWRQSVRGRADVASETRKLQAYYDEHGRRQLRR